MRVLLVGPSGHGGEEVYVQGLLENPPDGVSYSFSGDFHRGAAGARCRVITELLLNRVVHPIAVPDMGFRALRLTDRFDLVHVHAHPVRLTALRGTPVVMSEGSSSAVYLKEYLNWSDGRIARGYRRSRALYRILGIHDRLLTMARASRVYVFSEWAKAVNVRWGADPEKMDVVYPGFPTPPEVDRSGREAFRFLFVGTDFERKGGFEVVEAFAGISGRFPAARLDIVSADPSIRNADRQVHGWVTEPRRAAVRCELRRLVRAGLVCWRPLSTRAVLYRDVYPTADAFVMPSHAEGFGFTNVEALSWGIPVISSTVGPIPEILKHQRTGLLVPPGDVAALAAAMTRLLESRSLAIDLGTAGRRDFLARFTNDRFRASVDSVYRRALEL